MEGWLKFGIFVASTAEVKDFRDVLDAVAADLNHTLGRERRLLIDLVRWETHARPAAGRPQAVINRQIGSYDLFVGILWKRFGTPSGLANSGTEEEFRIAWDLFQRGAIADILFYFCEQPWWPGSEEELDQFRQVLRFRRELATRLLSWPVLDKREFADLVRGHLYNAITRILTRGAGDPSSMRFAPELERQLEQTRREAIASGIPMRTPSLLLMLLRAPGSPALKCFERVSPGLGATLDSSLAAYLASPEAKTGMPDRVPDWHERPEMIAAWEEARGAGDTRIAQRDLFVALLRSPSRTIVELRDRLGPAFAALVAHAESIPRHEAGWGVTPGRIL